jgi:ubiquinone/menaquinone biosynthesis C-methylase UbiE
MREILGQMRQEWDLIARRNAFYGVVSWPEFEALDRVDRDKFWALGKESVDNFLAQLPLGKISTGTMVEIGCGLGRMTHRFSERFGRVYAVDVSPEMLTRAKAQWAGLSNVEFILGHGNDLPGIADHSVDFVFSFIVLQHVPDQTIVKDYLRETARVLKPGALAHLQFRTDVIVKALRESFAFRAVCAVTHPRRAFNTLVARLGSWVFPPRVIQSVSNPTLADEFSRFESWRGCALAPDEVESFALSIGLRTENVTGVGTQYTFYTFRRQ